MNSIVFGNGKTEIEIVHSGPERTPGVMILYGDPVALDRPVKVGEDRRIYEGRHAVTLEFEDADSINELIVVLEKVRDQLKRRMA